MYYSKRLAYDVISLSRATVVPFIIYLLWEASPDPKANSLCNYTTLERDYFR